MRRVIFTILFVLMFVVACSSYEKAIREQENVKVFTAMAEETTYSETSFSGADARAVADLVKAECPQGVGESFIRATLEAKSATLILYTTPNGKNVTCSVLKPKEQKQITIKPQAEAPDEQTIITVNGKPITREQAQRAAAALPQGTKFDDNTTALLLNGLVNQELLRQKAEGISVTEKEIAEARDTLLKGANLTAEQLDNAIATQNLSREEFDQDIEQQAKVNKLLKTHLMLDRLNISEADARNYYLQNTNQFIQSEQAVARYIIISGEGRSAEQGRARAQQIAAELNKTDFCDLVKKYSDDKNGAQNCGVYVIPRGVLDSNLEQASFRTPVNQTSVVQTDSGIYFVQTLQVTPAQVVPYPNIAENLQTSLRSMIAEQRLNLYLVMLRNDAEIVSYLG